MTTITNPAPGLGQSCPSTERNVGSCATGEAGCDHFEDYCAPIICPVTQQPCMTEQDEFCEDYGCARKAGYDVDQEWGV